MASSYKTRMSSRSAVKSLKTSKSSDSSMGIWIVLGLLLLLIIIVIVAGGFYKRFEKFSNPPPPILKYFYMTSCPHCIDFNPIWEKLKTKVENEKINVTLVKYNISDNGEGSEQAALYNVKGAPTIILDKNDVHNEYNGNRSVDDIIKFIKEKTT